MKIINYEYNLVPIINTIHILKKSFVFRPFLENKMRVLMSEKTRTELRKNITNDNIESKQETCCGIKVMIDNDIPFGECEIFINATEVIQITSEK